MLRRSVWAFYSEKRSLSVDYLPLLRSSVWTFTSEKLRVQKEKYLILSECNGNGAGNIDNTFNR